MIVKTRKRIDRNIRFLASDLGGLFITGDPKIFDANALRRQCSVFVDKGGRVLWWLWVLSSGSVGVLIRGFLERGCGFSDPRIATGLANALGCWAAGFLLHSPLSSSLRSALLLGFCGGLTTLSSWLIQIYQALFQQGTPRWGEFFILFSVHFLGGLCCLWLGTRCARF